MKKEKTQYKPSLGLGIEAEGTELFENISSMKPLLHFIDFRSWDLRETYGLPWFTMLQ